MYINSHNPKVMWFKSHIRNHFSPAKPWLNSDKELIQLTTVS